eukprot:SAG11_NODE_472_length_9191_cov_5.863851_1_plen_1268_part_00
MANEKPHPLTAKYKMAEDEELKSMFNLLLGSNRVRLASTGVAAGDSATGLDFESCRLTLDFLGCTVTREEALMMWAAAFNHQDNDEAELETERQILDSEKFEAMTRDALREIHGDARMRTSEHLWGTVFKKMQIIREAHVLGEKIKNLHQLYGVTECRDSDERINIARQLLEDAMLRRGSVHKITASGRRIFGWLNRFHRFFAAAVWVNFMIGWVEDDGHEDHDSFVRWHVNGKTYYAVPILELTCCAIHFLHCVLRVKAAVYWPADGWLVGKCFVTVLIISDASRILLLGPGTAPVTRMLRAYLLLDIYPNVRQLFDQFINALKALKELSLLGMVGLIFYVLAGLMMYPVPDETSTPPIMGTSQGATVFVDLHARIMQLLYLTIGAVNYPDVMLPAYVEDGNWALLYFGSFAILFIFVFLNIALAVIYQRYTQDREEDIVEQNAKRHVALALAYQTIDQDDSKSIDRTEFMNFMKVYRSQMLDDDSTILGSLRGDSSKQERELQAELDLIWTELQPKKVVRADTSTTEEIGPTEFINLPGILASKSFRRPPEWAVRGLHWSISDLKPIIDGRKIVHVVDKVSGGQKVYREPDEGHQFKEDDEVILTQVRADFGEERVLCRRLKKLKHGDSTVKDSSTGQLRNHPCNNLRDITQPEQHQIDFDNGNPLLWKRPEDVHEDEAVIFHGRVTGVSSEGHLDIYCKFDGYGSDETSRKHGCLSRFLNGGLFPSLRDVLLHPIFRWFINVTILLAMVMSMLQYVYRSVLIDEGLQSWGHILADYVITAIFDVEMLLKWFALGFRGYWKSTWHRLDGIICVAVTISTVSLLLDDVAPKNNDWRHRYWEILKMMRALRVFRVLNLLTALQYVGKPQFSIDRYRLIFAVTTHALKSMFNFAVFVAAVFYAFAVIGIQLFGGPDGLTRDFNKACGHSSEASNPVVANSLLGGAQSFDGASYESIGFCDPDSYALRPNVTNADTVWGTVHSYYYGINFDTMGAAYVALFHLLIMNNWHVTHEACVAVFKNRAAKCVDNGIMGGLCHAAHSPWTVSAYFLLFLLFVSIVLVNILLSFFLDIYSFVWNEYTKSFEQKINSRADEACERVVKDLDKMWDRKFKQEARAEGNCCHKILGHIGLGYFYDNRDGLNPVKDMLDSTMKCSSCLLSQPYVHNIDYRFSPLFVPEFGMFKSINGYDTVVMCDACSAYWKAMEMLTCDRGIIYKQASAEKSISEAMAEDDICNDNANMQLKIRIMLKLGDDGIPVVKLDAVDINLIG